MNLYYRYQLSKLFLYKTIYHLCFIYTWMCISSIVIALIYFNPPFNSCCRIRKCVTYLCKTPATLPLKHRRLYKYTQHWQCCIWHEYKQRWWPNWWSFLSSFIQLRTETLSSLTKRTWTKCKLRIKIKMSWRRWSNPAAIATWVCKQNQKQNKLNKKSNKHKTKTIKLNK